MATCPEAGTLKRGDCIVIIGDWIYDSGHEGWNEFHPVKQLFKNGAGVTAFPVTYMSVAPVTNCQGMTADRIQEITELVREPEASGTKERQKLIEKQWVINERVG